MSYYERRTASFLERTEKILFCRSRVLRVMMVVCVCVCVCVRLSLSLSPSVMNMRAPRHKRLGVRYLYRLSFFSFFYLLHTGEQRAQ